MKKCLLISASLASLLAFAGCATDSATAEAKPTEAAASGTSPKAGAHKIETLIPVAKINAIAKGMKAEQVQELLGKPNNVTPFTAGAVTGEIWIYRITETIRAEQIPTGMRDVPSWDLATNKMITIKEPIYQIQNVRTYRTLELLIVDGRLIERRPGADQERTYN